MTNTLNLPHGQLRLPVFLPDATYGMVRSLDARDTTQTGIQALVMNAFHLMQRPGTTTIQALGGLHQMAAWQKPIITDSGGFQAFSMIRENSKYGTITDKGINFKRESDSRKFQLTPEKIIQLQLKYDTDIAICLDDCTHVDDPLERQQQSVERTIRWAQRCKNEFVKLTKNKTYPNGQRPLLFAVVQGGGEKQLRKQCAEALLEIGFDGYGYGGYPLDGQGNLLEDIVAYIRELIPAQFPLHALGVGHPKNVKRCYELGYQIFDCALPTRDARRGRLYTFTQESGLDGDNWYKFLYLQDEKHLKTSTPISPHCDCATCQQYSLGYLHHLFNINDPLIYRLATIHNLRFMTQLEDRLAQLGTPWIEES